MYFSHFSHKLQVSNFDIEKVRNDKSSAFYTNLNFVRASGPPKLTNQCISSWFLSHPPHWESRKSNLNYTNLSILELRMLIQKSSLYRTRMSFVFYPFLYQYLTPGDYGKKEKTTFRLLIASESNFVLDCHTYFRYWQGRTCIARLVLVTQ